MNVFTVLGVFLVAFPLLVVVGVLGVAWRAWWLYPTWAWFIVPLGAPAISFWHFTALIFIIGVLTVHPDMKKDDRKVEWAGYINLLVWPIVAWAILRWMHGA